MTVKSQIESDRKFMCGMFSCVTVVIVGMVLFVVSCVVPPIMAFKSAQAEQAKKDNLAIERNINQ